MNIETLKKALGKKRLEKIQAVALDSEYQPNDFIDVLMKRPYINRERETIVLAARGDDETVKEWVDYVKYRIDEMDYNPNLWDAVYPQSNTNQGGE